MLILNIKARYVFRLIGIIILTSVNSISHAEELVDRFKQSEALPIYRAPPYYPTHQLENGNSGVVDLKFMVDKHGNTFEPMVSSATYKSFERPAIKSASQYRYLPVIYNGEPVEHFESIRIIFVTKDTVNKSTRSFAKKYRMVMELFNEEKPIDKKQIEKQISKLERMGNLSPYSLGSISLLKFKYANNFEDLLTQIEAASNLLSLHSAAKNKILSDEEKHSVRKGILSLYIKNQQYTEALFTIKILEKHFSDNLIKLETIKTEINSIYHNDQTVVSKIKIHKRGHSSMYLFKDSFSLNDIDGRISALKLRCRNKFTELKLDPDSDFKIPKSWGKCHMQIIGDVGTTAQLVQF